MAAYNEAKALLTEVKVKGDGSCFYYAVKEATPEHLRSKVEGIFNIEPGMTREDKLEEIDGWNYYDYNPLQRDPTVDQVYFSLKVRQAMVYHHVFIEHYTKLQFEAESRDFETLLTHLEPSVVQGNLFRISWDGFSVHEQYGFFTPRNESIRTRSQSQAALVARNSGGQWIVEVIPGVYADEYFTYLSKNLLKNARRFNLNQSSWVAFFETDTVRSILRENDIFLETSNVTSFYHLPEGKRMLVITNAGTHYSAFLEDDRPLTRSVAQTMHQPQLSHAFHLSDFDALAATIAASKDETVHGRRSSEKTRKTPPDIKPPEFRSIQEIHDIVRSLHRPAASISQKRPRFNPQKIEYGIPLSHADAVAAVNAYESFTNPKSPPCKYHQLGCHTRKFWRKMMKEKRARAKTKCAKKTGFENFWCHLFS